MQPRLQLHIGWMRWAALRSCKRDGKAGASYTAPAAMYPWGWPQPCCPPALQFAKFKFQGCGFLVAGRTEGGKFMTLADMPMPATLQRGVRACSQGSACSWSLGTFGHRNGQHMHVLGPIAAMLVLLEYARLAPGVSSSLSGAVPQPAATAVCACIYAHPTRLPA